MVNVISGTFGITYLFSLLNQGTHASLATITSNVYILSLHSCLHIYVTLINHIIVKSVYVSTPFNNIVNQMSVMEVGLDDCSLTYINLVYITTLCLVSNTRLLTHILVPCSLPLVLPHPFHPPSRQTVRVKGRV